MKNTSGFTLIEIVISIGLMALIGLVANNMLFNIFRGTLKGETIKEAKQNGDYALSLMENDIRNAVAFDGPCTASMNNLRIKTSLEPKATYSYVRYEYYVESGNYIIKVISDVTSAGVPVKRDPEIPLTDKNKVDVASIQFNCDPVTRTVVIQFVVEGRTITAARSEDRAYIPFRSQVTIRNR